MATQVLRPLILEELKPPLKVTLINDTPALDALREFISREQTIGVDVETNICDFFFYRKLRTIQIGNKSEQYVVDLLAGLDYDSDRLSSLQGHYGERLSESKFLQDLVDVLRPVLDSRSHLKVGHSLRFEYEMLKWNLGIRMWNIYDTREANKVIFSGIKHLKNTEVTSLRGVCAHWLNFEIRKELQTTFDLTSRLTTEQVDYAALDTRLPLAVMRAQMAVINADGLSKAVQIENDALPAFGDMHLNGLLIDRERWTQLLDEVIERHTKNVARLDEFFLPVVGSKKIEVKFDELIAQKDAAQKTYDEFPKVRGNGPARQVLLKAFRTANKVLKDAIKTQAKLEKAADTYEGEAAINYGSNPQLLKTMRTMGYGYDALPSTNDNVLMQLAGDELIDALRDYRETGKVISTYGESFLALIQPETGGRVHSNIDQLGAATGRSSSEKPNVQNILHGNWRDCFIAAPGWVMLTIDYNGCELRILAELSKEKVWIDAFNNGWDVHSVGAEIIFGKAWTEATEPGCAYAAHHQKCKCAGHVEFRNKIKAINFGIAYGMTADKLSKELGISFGEADRLIKHYKLQFPAVTRYLVASGQFAMSRLESRTICGRRRKYPKPTWDAAKEKAEEWGKKRKDEQAVTQKNVNSAYKSLGNSIDRMGKNAPIQGTNADLAKLAMGCGFDETGKPFLWHIIEPVYGAKLVNFVHDELVVEAKEEVQQKCFDAVGDGMTRAGAVFVKSVPMTTEGHIAPFWKK